MREYRQHDEGNNIVVYLNGKKASFEDLLAFVDDYHRYGKGIVTHKFKGGRFVFIETR